MRILITGGGGFIGQKLARRLAAEGTLRGEPIRGLTLVDLSEPAPVEAPFPVTRLACDISEGSAVAALMAPPFDVIFHLAAVVSGAAEADFDLGMRVNLFGTLNLLQSARAGGNAPSSSMPPPRPPMAEKSRKRSPIVRPRTPDLLRHAEGDRRVPADRHVAPRLPRRPRPATAHRLDPPRQGQCRGLVLHVLDLPRHDAGGHGKLPGRPRFRGLAYGAPDGRRQSDSRSPDRGRGARAPTAAST